MVDIFLLAEGFEEVGCALLELVWVDKGAPDVLERDAALLTRIVVRIAVFGALSNVMAGFFAALANVSLWQVTSVTWQTTLVLAAVVVIIATVVPIVDVMVVLIAMMMAAVKITTALSASTTATMGKASLTTPSMPILSVVAVTGGF